MRAISIVLLVGSFLATACSGFIAVETRHQRNHPVVVHEATPAHPAHLGIPPGHLPPPGRCRIWIPGRPPGHQQPPGTCSTLRDDVPVGAWLVYRPSRDRKYVEVSVYDRKQPHLVVAVGLYDANSGRFVRDAKATRPR